MNLIILCIFIFECISQHKAKVIFNIRIHNYNNEDNVKHDGTSCDDFIFVTEKCDPIFSICVTSVKNCDIFNTKVNHWRNKESLHMVFKKQIQLETMPTSVSVQVKVDDYDSDSSHDYIGIFSTSFSPKTLKKYYQSKMSISPVNLKVSLYTSVMINCAKNFYGNQCNIFCLPDQNKYKCDSSNGSKICTKACGNGRCNYDKYRDQFSCECNIGWEGRECQELIPVTTGSISASIKSVSVFQTSTSVQTMKPDTTKIHQVIRNIKTIKQTKITTRKSEHPKTIKPSTTTISTVDHLIQKEKYIVPFAVNSTLPQTPIMIMIICLLALLCVCVITMLIMITIWQRKQRRKLPESTFKLRPLPEIIYRPPKAKTSHNLQTKSELSDGFMRQDNVYESCNGPSRNSEKYSSNLVQSNYESVKFDPYEEPMINNMESLTCETNCNNSDDSDLYEIPIKL